MRHATLSAFAILLAAGAHGQLFQSGFENWTGTVPDGWSGLRTNIAASAVTQVSVNPHAGSHAVRLENTLTLTADHRRFSTQDLTVTANQTYEVTFWARGRGDVRLGLYDGRSGSGFAAYTQYTTINNNDTWQRVDLSITAAMNAPNAQFVLSVKSTVAPEHLVIDDVTITGGSVNPPQDATVRQIQETTDPGGASPLENTIVTTSGVVMGLVPGTSPGFFIQDGGGPWSGIFVFFATTGIDQGDSLRVTGTVVEFNGQTQLSNVTVVQNLASGRTLTETVIATQQGNTEPYESVLVTVRSATCTASGAFGQFTVNDGSGPVLVDDVIYAHPFQVGAVYDITGVLQFAFNEWRILPRDNGDVRTVTGIAERKAIASVRVFPNPASDVLMVDGSEWSGPATYTIADATGREVMNGTLVGNVLSMEGLANGTYTLVLRTAEGAWQARVVVRR